MAVLYVAVSVAAPPLSAETLVPPFKARALSGGHRTEQDLLGQPTVLVITPTKTAARESKRWGEELQEAMPPRVALRALLAVDIPFFVPDDFAVRKAQEKVPARLWDRTWLLTHGKIEEKLGLPDGAAEPFVFALDADGRIVARTRGAVTTEKIRLIADALLGAAVRCEPHRSAAR
jgi:hypothetical protein